VGAVAQGKSSLTVANKRDDAAKELARLTRKYGLTEEQKARIQPLLAEQQRQVHVLGEDESLSDMAWSAAVRKVHQLTMLKVKVELTDAQASKYIKDEEKEAKKSQDDGGDDGMDGPPDGPPPGGPGGGGPPPGE
jgi:periplasmic protein CpxP/Spy